MNSRDDFKVSNVEDNFANKDFPEKNIQISNKPVASKEHKIESNPLEKQNENLQANKKQNSPEPENLLVRCRRQPSSSCPNIVKSKSFVIDNKRLPVVQKHDSIVQSLITQPSEIFSGKTFNNELERLLSFDNKYGEHNLHRLNGKLEGYFTLDINNNAVTKNRGNERNLYSYDSKTKTVTNYGVVDTHNPKPPNKPDNLKFFLNKKTDKPNDYTKVEYKGTDPKFKPKIPIYIKNA